MEKVHPEGVERVGLDPVPINPRSSITWNDAQKSYAPYHVCLRVCFLGIGGRVKAFAKDVLQEPSPSAVCNEYDVRTFLGAVLVDDMVNSRRDVQCHLMKGREEQPPETH